MKISLSKLNFLNTFMTIIVFSFILGFFIYSFNKTILEKNINELEKSFYENNRALIKKEVNRKVADILTIKESMYEEAKRFLIEKNEVVQSLLTYDRSKENFSDLLFKYVDTLDSIKWDNQTGYFYIFDEKGKVLYHGADKTLENRNIFDISADNERLLKILKDSLLYKEFSGTYSWVKPNTNSNALVDKFVYIKKNQKHNIYIAASIYKDELDRRIMSLIRKELYVDRFGEDDYGYFWIHGLDKKMKIHPFLPGMEGKDLSHLKLSNGRFLLKYVNDKALNGDGFVEYEWKRPDTLKQDKKVSYVTQIPDYLLVIGSGFYLTELNDLLKKEKEKLEQLSTEYISNILTILTILSVIVFILSRYISTKIELVEQKEKEQLNLLEQYKMLLDKSSVVSKSDLKGKITYVNSGFEKLTGYYKNEIIGKNHNIIRHPNVNKNKFKKLWELIQNGDTWKGIMKNRDKYGNTYYNSTVIVPIKNSKNEIIEYISSGTDITNVYRLQEEKEKAYLFDELTGLKSINGLNKELCDKNGFMILLDIADFSKINGLIGYEGANEILEELADILREKSNYVYRIYGDKFAIFYENISLEKTQEEATNILLEVVNHKFMFKDIDLPVSINIGVSNIQPYLKTSEIAIAENKNTFNRISIYDDSMDDKESAQKNFSMLNKIKSALQDDHIRPFFQPIVDLETKEPIKYEALVRLIDGEKAISPFFFLDIAMKSKLYPEITKKVFKKSIEFIKSKKVPVSINISYQDIINTDVLNYISIVLQLNEDIAPLITFEILESDEIDDYEKISSFINTIRRHGSKLAIDDFGSGYSNFTQLLNMEPDIVKIDGSLIKDIHLNKNSKDIVEAILILTKKKNIKTVAEFIDNDRIHEVVKELGVDYGQGFFYSPPKDLLNS